MKPRSILIALLTTVAAAGPAPADVLTLPPDRRPEWLARDGIVMAGSWEPLLFRVRRDGSNGYTPTPDQQAAWDREHSPDMIRRLQNLGVNFVMMHCYKGAGLVAERQSMADAVAFARLCHDAGLRVGVYNYSGAFLWELFYKEVPAASEWILLDEQQQPILYGQYRYFWNRNHPEAAAFYRQLVRFAVQDVRADLIHFDNYHESAGFDARSIEDFRHYLRETFPPDRLAQAGLDPRTARPPRKNDPPGLLAFAWRDFQCEYLARSYLDMSRYARSLRPDILMECNPMSVPRVIRPPVDHARILPGGEAFWDESSPSGLKDGKPVTRIRTCKVARLMDNMAFAYVTTPLEAAESMAFNHPDCLGCVCWFEYADVVARPGRSDPMSPALEPYIRFFHRRRDLLRDARVAADVAVLRSFPSQVFADPAHRETTAAVEDDLIARRVPFQIVTDRHLHDLARYRALVLAGCAAMSDSQIDRIAAFVRAGGRLCLVGPAATHDEWMRPRKKSALDDLPTASATRVSRPDQAVDALRTLCGPAFQAAVEADGPLAVELTDQTGRRLVHLVNYDPARPIENIRVSLRLPAGRPLKTVRLADPLHPEDAPLPAEQIGDRATFTVPRIAVYGIAVVTLQ